MNATKFSGVQIFDGTGGACFAGDVLVEGDRIVAVRRTTEPPIEHANAATIDGSGATLMPGLIESHAHLTWPSSIERFVPGMELPIAELTLTAARNARILLDHGYTSAYSAGALDERLEMALKTQIDSGGLPGPRLIPSTIERSPEIAVNELKMSERSDHGRGPEAVRNFLKHCADIGAKSVKLLLSGEDALMPGSSQHVLYTEEEARAAGEQARESNLWLAAHAQASEAVKMALRNNFRVIYHCTWADAEAIDMLESKKNDIFYGPAVGILQAILDTTPPPFFDMTYMKQSAAEALQRLKVLVPELRRRGLRVLPGGDYGFPFNPTGLNARDLQLFVEHFGYTPAEALAAATSLGGEIMGMKEELGQIRPGYLADLLLVKGDPTQNVSLLQDRSNLLAIMKDGRFHKHPNDRPT